MIARYVPLSRRTPLVSRPVSEAGRPSWVTRELVQERDGRCCVVCGRGGLVHLHHRRPVRAGGSRNPETHAAANLICVCADCHRRIHSRPAQSREAGLLLRAGADPKAVPIRVHGRSLLLRDDGGITEVADGPDTPGLPGQQPGRGPGAHQRPRARERAGGPGARAPEQHPQ